MEHSHFLIWGSCYAAAEPPPTGTKVVQGYEPLARNAMPVVLCGGGSRVVHGVAVECFLTDFAQSVKKLDTIVSKNLTIVNFT